MAVVQISRIQVRRGKASDGEIPQLASGELGWAVDERALYIGNGSVAEGAPTVGNTKILTEFTDIFNLDDQYQYRKNDSFIQTGSTSTTPIRRTLQSRLDDTVSVRGFGITGAPTIDITVDLQRAIDQLFINESNKGNPNSRVELKLEPGVYRITDTIHLPPYAKLIGSGVDSTIIKFEPASGVTNTAPMFDTVNETSTPDNPADDSTSLLDNQARELFLSNMTLQKISAGPGIVCQSLKNSKFSNIKFLGHWERPIAPTIENSAVVFNQLGGGEDGVITSDLIFEDCIFDAWSYAFSSEWDVRNIVVTDSTFTNLHIGMQFAKNQDDRIGQQSGPEGMTIDGNSFSKIERQAINFGRGTRNLLQNNKYRKCGNDNGQEIDPLYSIVNFDSHGNKILNDSHQRTHSMIFEANRGYLAELSGNVSAEFADEHFINISYGIAQTNLFYLPGTQNVTYTLPYYLQSNSIDAQRFGEITITVDYLGGSPKVELTDEYQFIGDESFNEHIKFDAVLQSHNNVYTVNVRASNNEVGDLSTLKFGIKIVT